MRKQLLIKKKTLYNDFEINEIDLSLIPVNRNISLDIDKLDIEEEL